MIYLYVITSYIAFRCYWNSLENRHIMDNQSKIVDNQKTILKQIKNAKG